MNFTPVTTSLTIEILKGILYQSVAVSLPKGRVYGQLNQNTPFSGNNILI
jgi:hypothetical protein